MTNAELLAKIKAEIERRIKELGISDEAIIITEELSELLSFLDTLEEPVCEDELYKEIERWINSPEEWDNNIQDIEATARHFAKWGVEHLKK